MPSSKVTTNSPKWDFVYEVPEKGFPILFSTAIFLGIHYGMQSRTLTYKVITVAGGGSLSLILLAIGSYKKLIR